VIASAIAIAAGAPILDPVIGLGMTVVILRITRESWRTVHGHPTTIRGYRGDPCMASQPRGPIFGNPPHPEG